MEEKEKLRKKERKGKNKMSTNNGKLSVNKGITLVALVVTIVVLLILAGVTITYVLGDKGIIKTTKEARDQTDEAIGNEQNDIGDLADWLKQEQEESKNYGKGDQIKVTNITLNKTAMEIDIGKKETLTVTVEPEDAENKEIEWTAGPEGIVTVDQNGNVTGVAAGTATITATAKDGSGKSATCSVIIESDWTKIAEVAKLVAEDSEITNDTPQITKGGMTIKVEDQFYVKYDGALKEVRVLGFNHDTLTTPTATATKAGISFEFIDCLGTHNMNGTNEPASTNENGWEATEMKTFLDGEINSNKFSVAFKNNVKQVKKQYIKKYDDTSSNNNYSNDKLWLLAASEVFATGYTEGYYAYAITTEGDQYKFYKELNSTWDSDNPKLIKKVNDSAYTWWLRSPKYSNNTSFCCVYSAGSGGYHSSYRTRGVAAGFSI